MCYESLTVLLRTGDSDDEAALAMSSAGADAAATALLALCSPLLPHERMSRNTLKISIAPGFPLDQESMITDFHELATLARTRAPRAQYTESGCPAPAFTEVEHNTMFEAQTWTAFRRTRFVRSNWWSRFIGT